ncbi:MULTISPECIES: hypothetical protein [unclassified Parafrankia]|uniref:hypothetical protein n=1 Tax=unclassified Parafrankia TaxID=2994368 RepID=UPI000DA50623|nr:MULTISPECIES: hypothetical protein [unclassified Parafrankia]TCJ40550.1 hypothetical protein E0504_04305 [Parafrankia sp. BMG5.11]CAI7974761.1 conserved hypothetical protein [Frankia sp. Hr75.2]SQD95198.1 hypothetical protein FMEAI12_3050015 [Parafrankia sp. Ea1.12]
MRALVTDGSAASGLRLGEVPDPVPGPDQVLIRTAAISLVDRDTGYAAAMLGDGGVWGFDAAGGSTMTRAVDLLAEGGTALAVGAISGERMVFPPAAFASPLRRRVRGFWGSWPVGGDLATVVELVAAGRLCPRPGWRGGWGEVAGLLESFAAGRTRRRRAVLDVV